MKLGVPKETAGGERRVALTPEAAAKLAKSGWEVRVEAGAGARAFYPDAAYADAGAAVVGDRNALLADLDVLALVGRPSVAEVDSLPKTTVVIGMLEPLTRLDLMRALAARGVTALAMETIPRVTRAQAMDALSSQASIAGYKAMILAADTLGRYVPMLVTAAGTVAPARVLVLGAGVAGLQAIATARRLGAVISAYDVRSTSREEVQSLGAKFIEPPEVAEGAGGYAKEMEDEAQKRQLEILAPHVADADIVITTAQIPGKRAPCLVTEAMVRAMRPGSVIVDLAAATGGNCELTKADVKVEAHGVTIHGPSNAAALLPTHASQLYARNVSTLLGHLAPEGALKIDLDDEITRGACIVHEGRIVNDRVRALAEEKAS